jgi:plastocyanin domain-containing protein
VRLAHVPLAALLALALACRGGPNASGSVQVKVTPNGYEPWKIPAKKGEKLVLVVTRTTDKTCATEVVIPELGMNVPLPLGEPVRIELTPPHTGEIKFACGMNMFQGVIDVR